MLRGWLQWSQGHDWWERMQMINLLVVLWAFEASHLPDEVQAVQSQVIHVLASPQTVQEELPELFPSQ